MLPDEIIDHLFEMNRRFGPVELGWARWSMGKRSRKLWLVSGFLYLWQVCDAPAVGKRVSKSATTGGRTGNRYRSRRSGASRLLVPGPPFHGPRPAGPPRHRPPPMKRILVQYGCQGKPLPAAPCTGRGAAVGRLPCRSTWPRHGTSGSSMSRQARDSGSPWPIREPGGGKLSRQLVGRSVP